MEIRVGGGERRHVKLQCGDMLVVIDTRGAGHETAITGDQNLVVAGVSFAAADWPRVRDAFSGWPANLVPP